VGNRMHWCGQDELAQYIQVIPQTQEARSTHRVSLGWWLLQK
jgi:hypothetical protein